MVVVDWDSVTNQDIEHVLGFEALDLQLPKAVISCEKAADGFVTLTKPDPHVLQLKANHFRKGYKNWRKHKPRGARGEVNRIEQLDTSPETAAAIAAAEASTSETPMSPFHRNKSAMSPRTPEHSLRGSKSFGNIADAEQVEESWLKFFVNPYANLLDGAIESVPLVHDNLPHIYKNFSQVRGRIPTYDRTSKPGSYHRICHVGVGGFHRSHQAVFTDDLLELHKDRPECPRWAICGVGLMPWDRKMYDALTKQDYLYTVLFRSQEGNDARVIGAILDFIFAPEDYGVLMNTLCDTETRIVSLTITEKGYCQRVDGSLDTNDPNIKSDLIDLSRPRTAIGMLVAALEQRWKRGMQSFTVLSCDNVADNGHQLKHLVLQMAELAVGPELKKWIEGYTTFPNSMVDRITPATEGVHKDILKQDFGVEDEWPVVAEHYGQWIIEDQFVNGERPAWEDVGVMFVPDVKPYEYMKLRLLNGGHSALSYVAYLAGYQFVDDAMNNKQIEDFTLNYMDEVCHSVPSVPGVDLEVYKKNLVQRFSNPYVKDRVERLMLDGSKKLPNTMRTPIIHLSKAGLNTTFLGLAVAAFIRYVAGVDDNGADFPDPVLDPLAKELKGPALKACRFEPIEEAPDMDGYSNGTHPAIENGTPPACKPTYAPQRGPGEYDPRGVLEIVLGPEVAGLTTFVEDVSLALAMICEKGMVYALLMTA